jgi:hypothetical protein
MDAVEHGQASYAKAEHGCTKPGHGYLRAEHAGVVRSLGV